mgnify:CR=1 FL=1
MKVCVLQPDYSTTAVDYKNYELFPISEVFNFQDGFAFPSSKYTTKPYDIKIIRIQKSNF